MYEVIDLLCNIVAQQAAFIKKMTGLFLQANFSEELKSEIKTRENKIECDIESAETKIRLLQ